MKALHLHRWSVTPRQAARIQLCLRQRFESADRLQPIEYVAGADVALDLRRNIGIAGVIIYRFPEMIECERVWAERPLTFPYVPGLLSFREIPVLLRAFAKLRHVPQLVFYDGHGYSHPRRFGIACHLGVLLDCPTVGCAKSILVGKPDEPGIGAGSWAPLLDDGEVIAAVLRTRDATKPVYISQGHRISLERALEFARAVGSGYRIPRPTREADIFVGQVKRLSANPRENQSRSGDKSKNKNGR